MSSSLGVREENRGADKRAMEVFMREEHACAIQRGGRALTREEGS